MAKVFVALDFPRAEAAWKAAEKLLPVNPYLKVGLELFVAEGPSFVEKLQRAGAEVFLDLKFHDIPQTVEGAVRSATRLGVKYLNVHCGGGREMLSRAAEACADEAAKHGLTKPQLLGVTVLTSLDDAAVAEIGFPRSASAQVKQFVELALDSGLDGVVCSGQELPLVRGLAGDAFTTMVPGIRPLAAAANDQKRTLSPAEAVAAGAHCLVVGRPVTASDSPAKALEAILREIKK